MLAVFVCNGKSFFFWKRQFDAKKGQLLQIEWKQRKI